MVVRTRTVKTNGEFDLCYLCGARDPLNRFRNLRGLESIGFEQIVLIAVVGRKSIFKTELLHYWH